MSARTDEAAIRPLSVHPGHPVQRASCPGTPTVGASSPGATQLPALMLPTAYISGPAKGGSLSTIRTAFEGGLGRLQDMFSTDDDDDDDPPQGVRDALEDALDNTGHALSHVTSGLRDTLEKQMDATSGRDTETVRTSVEEAMDRASKGFAASLPTKESVHRAVDGKLASALENAQRIAFRDTPPTPAVPTPVAPTIVAPKAVAPTPVAPTPVAPKAVSPTIVAPKAVAPTPVAPTVVAPSEEAIKVGDAAEGGPTVEGDDDDDASEPSSLHGPAENASRATFAFFSNTQQESRTYSSCATYANAVASITRKTYDHTTTVIFGGDSSDPLDGSVGSWARWVRKDEGGGDGGDGDDGDDGTTPEGIGPVSTMSALRSDGHVSMLGARDAAMVRLMPYVEIPPLHPASHRHGGGDDDVRDRMIRALRARTIVSAPEWETYNLAIEAAFADISKETSADTLNTMAFCKLALLANETMAPKGAAAGAVTGLVPSFVRIAMLRGEVDADVARSLLSVVRRCVMWGPNEQEVASVRSEKTPEGVRVWAHEQVVHRTALRLLETVTSATTLTKDDKDDKDDNEPALVASMRAVVAAVHAWVSPGGSMYDILTSTGSLVHVEEGTSAHGAPWRIASVHAGTSASGTEDHVLFAEECLYKLPIGYDAERPGGIVWGLPWVPLSLSEWAATLNDQYRHMVAHAYKCAADGDLRGMAYVPNEGTIRVGTDDKAPPRVVDLNAIPYSWPDLLAILCTLSGGARNAESTGPLHAAHFGVPGTAVVHEESHREETDEYARTPTLWLVGAHSHPTADRLSSPLADAGHKAAVRVATHTHAPSFAVAITTDCDDLVNDLSEAVQEQWDPSTPEGLPDFVSSTDAIDRLATDLRFPPDMWASLVVGPEVQHVGVNGVRTRARLLVWHNNQLRPEDCTCLFVTPSLVDALPCDVTPRGFPLHTILAGVLVVPYVDGEGQGMGERVLLVTNKGAAAKLAKGVEARTADVDLSDPSTLVRTTVVDYEDDFHTKAACMGYCVLPSDSHCGMRLGVHEEAGGGWSLVCA